MSIHSNIKAKYAGSPALLVIAGLGITTTMYGIYRYWYKPWHKRQQLLEAEIYANFLYKNEKKQE